MTALTPDAEKFNTPRHFGREIMRCDERHDAEILPTCKPKLRRIKALAAKEAGDVAAD